MSRPCRAEPGPIARQGRAGRYPRDRIEPDRPGPVGVDSYDGEIAHPGAQFSFTDHDGHRFGAILTDQGDPDIAYLEARHRGHARVEDRIRTGKDTGMAKLPFQDFAINEVWLQISLIAQDLLAWTRALSLDAELAACEPKRIRYRLLHVAARITFHARTAIIRLDQAWRWATHLAAAFARLAALPPPTR